MRTLGTRRAVLVAGVTAAAAVALAGCSAGQVAETALLRPGNQGVNANNSNGSVGIRDLEVSYNGIEGYPAGANAPLEVGFYNLTTQEVTVLVSSRPAPNDAANQQVVAAQQVGLVGGTSATPSDAASPSDSASPSTSDSASPSPSDSAAPSEPAVQPARIVLPPSGFASFLPGDSPSLQVIGLTKALTPGQAVNLVFEFSNGALPLTLQAPVATPNSPAPRGSGIPDENVESD